MGVAEDFKTLCTNLAIAKRATISDRYELITRRLNLEFWGTDSRTYHSIQAGSYGRGTATTKTSDVDMVFWLPYHDSGAKGNRNAHPQPTGLQGNGCRRRRRGG